MEANCTSCLLFLPPPSSSSDRINPYRIIYTIVTNEQAVELTFSPVWFSSCRIPWSFSRSLSEVVAWINLASLSTFCGPPPLPFTWCNSSAELLSETQSVSWDFTNSDDWLSSTVNPDKITPLNLSTTGSDMSLTNSFVLSSLSVIAPLSELESVSQTSSNIEDWWRVALGLHSSLCVDTVTARCFCRRGRLGATLTDCG